MKRRKKNEESHMLSRTEKVTGIAVALFVAVMLVIEAARAEDMDAVMHSLIGQTLPDLGDRKAEWTALVDIAKWNIERHFDGLALAGWMIPGFLGGAHFLRSYIKSPVWRHVIVASWCVMSLALASTVLGNLLLHNEALHCIKLLEPESRPPLLMKSFAPPPGLHRVAISVSACLFLTATIVVAGTLNLILRIPAASGSADSATRS